MKPTLYQTWCSTTGHLHDFLLSAGPGAPVDLTVPLRRDRHILTGHDGAWSTSGKFRQISPVTWENKSQFGLPKESAGQFRAREVDDVVTHMQKK